MAQRSFSTNARELYFLSSCASSPTQAIAESAPPWRPPGAAIGSSRLSSAMNCISSSSCRRDGSSSAPLRGSTDAEGWQRIGRISIARRSHSCTSLQSVSCSENFAIPHEVSGQTLRAEINEKQARSIKYQLTIAKLPLAKDLEDFEFANTPINETLVKDLAGGGFIAHARWAGASVGNKSHRARHRASRTSNPPAKVPGASQIVATLRPYLSIFPVRRVDAVTSNSAIDKFRLGTKFNTRVGVEQTIDVENE